MGHLGRSTPWWGRLEVRQEVRLLARRALVGITCGPLAARNTLANNHKVEEGRVRRVLVLRPDHLGDLLFATPALARLREAFPSAHITGAVGPWGRAMWQDHPALDALEVIPFPGIASRPQSPLEAYRLLARTARNISREKYDTGIVLRYDHWWGAALLWAAGVPNRWGYATRETGGWLNNRLAYVPGRHEVEQDLRLAEAMVRAHAETDNISHARPLRISRERGVPRPDLPRAVLCENAPPAWLAAPRRAIIHPGTGAANKLWTVQGWAAVADSLQAEGWSVILTGAPDERELAEAIREASRSKPPNLAGQTGSLGELVWLLGHARIVLGVDSGPLHMADAAGRPALHLYGPSDEKIWGPWGNPDTQRAFRAPGTRPSGVLDVASQALEGGPEMRAITVEMVLGEISKLTGAASAAPV